MGKRIIIGKVVGGRFIDKDGGDDAKTLLYVETPADTPIRVTDCTIVEQSPESMGLGEGRGPVGDRTKVLALAMGLQRIGSGVWDWGLLSDAERAGYVERAERLYACLSDDSLLSLARAELGV